MANLEVLFTPAEFSALPKRNLSDTCCVVFDVLRATSSMVTALANGAAGIQPVSELNEALEVRRRHPEALLAGERDGVRIAARLTGGTEFDLGNSPREFTTEVVRGRLIAMTTTNGTRALRACARAREVFACCFLNLGVTAERLAQLNAPNVLVVCSGTYEEAAYEDVLGAGALCELISQGSQVSAADSAYLARRLYQLEASRLLDAVSSSRNGRRLLQIPELRPDVAFCVQRDLHAVLARLDEAGVVRRVA